MTITKLGHSCLLVEEKGLKILIDPGNQSTTQNRVKGVDIVLITQEHADHFDLNSLRKVLRNNPKATLLTNRGVGTKLKQEKIGYRLLEHGQKIQEKGVLIEAFGKKHALFHRSLPNIDNTGYLIAGRFFHPGDAFTKPSKRLEILALPVAGSWMKIAEAIDYAKSVKPKVCFPIHDALLKNPGGAHRHPKEVLEPLGIKFQVLEIGKPTRL